ncbi:ATP-binding protein [Streptomyces zingiberis]|uniref:ATP-binding protein n=1 Tax=Streptomyces zingiberis TaxID=2053010 RepID=A0ABX1BYR7_9ACTN|nr:ATP-binding protein [Streptomyces zingiberis]NJQ01015.1 ATP-binding protein [Streptomyces zingiberis]
MHTPQEPWSYGLFVPHDPRAAGVVRATLRAALRAARLDCFVDPAELLVSELTTNAYRHAGGDAFISFDWAPDRLRVSVWDPSPELPEALRTVPPPHTAPVGDESESGRGLALLRCFADEWGAYGTHGPWGARPEITGKVVWFGLKA